MMPEEMKLERLQGIQNYVTGELLDSEAEILVSYYLTSIHDHSALEAFSKVGPHCRIWVSIYWYCTLLQIIGVFF